MTEEQRNDIFSKVLKFILATNYYYQIIDEVKETAFYRQNLKFHINQVEKELDKLQKQEAITEFYKIADSEKYLNNHELHDEFFKTLCTMPVGGLELFMIDFVTKYSKENENIC